MPQLKITRTSLSLILSAACLGILFTLFQNCSVRPNDTSVVASHFSETKTLGLSENSGGILGDGNGYEGKLYSFVDPQKCSQGAYQEIKIKGGEYYLTKDNCEDVAPRALTKNTVTSSPPSPDILSFQGGIFEDRKTDLPGYIAVICRAEIYAGDLKRGFVDGIIRAISPGKYSSEFRMMYPDMNLKEFQALSAQELGALNFEKRTFTAPIMQVPGPYGNPRQEYGFKVRQKDNPELLPSVEDPFTFAVSILYEQYNYVYRGQTINGRMRIPVRGGQDYFWTRSYCDRLINLPKAER